MNVSVLGKTVALSNLSNIAIVVCAIVSFYEGSINLIAYCWREPKLGHGFVPGNRSVAYHKNVWQELGGLPEDLTFYAEDSVFGRQIVEGGYNMAYAPKTMTY